MALISTVGVVGGSKKIDGLGSRIVEKVSFFSLVFKAHYTAFGDWRGVIGWVRVEDRVFQLDHQENLSKPAK